MASKNRFMKISNRQVEIWTWDDFKMFCIDTDDCSIFANYRGTHRWMNLFNFRPAMWEEDAPHSVQAIVRTDASWTFLVRSHYSNSCAGCNWTVLVCKTALPWEAWETAWRRTRQKQDRYFCQLVLNSQHKVSPNIGRTK